MGWLNPTYSQHTTMLRLFRFKQTILFAIEQLRKILGNTHNGLKVRTKKKTLKIRITNTMMEWNI